MFDDYLVKLSGLSVSEANGLPTFKEMTKKKNKKVSMSKVTTSLLSKNKKVYSFIEDWKTKRLHLNEEHPVGFLKKNIQNMILEACNGNIAILDNIDPVISEKDNFDKLYYEKAEKVRLLAYAAKDSRIMRTHMIAHYEEAFSENRESSFLAGDIYRRCNLTSHTSPVTHEVSVIKRFTDAKDLKSFVSNIISSLFKVDSKDVKFVSKRKTSVPYIQKEFEAGYDYYGYADFKPISGGILKKELAGDDDTFVINLNLDQIASLLLGVERRILHFRNIQAAYRLKPLNVSFSKALKFNDISIHDIYDEIRDTGESLYSCCHIYEHDDHASLHLVLDCLLRRGEKAILSEKSSLIHKRIVDEFCKVKNVKVKKVKGKRKS